MHPKDQQDFDEFIGELQRETDRGLALVGAALIDEKLQETLRAFFCDGSKADDLLEAGSAPLATFSARAQTCHALGLIDDDESFEIDLIRKVRNEFAHAKHGTSFKSSRIAGLCSTLRSRLPDPGPYPTNDPRFRFTNAILSVVIRLYYRPDYVSMERRQPKKWVDDAHIGWRSVDDELPPPGTPVIVMATPKPK